MINIIGITTEHTIEKSTHLANADLSRYSWIWVDVESPTYEEIKKLTETFQFHPMTMEHGLKKLQRPKLEHYHNHAFCITHIIKEADDEISKQELDFFVSENFIVTIHHKPVDAINQVWDMLNSQDHLDQWLTYSVFYEILNRIVDSYFPLIEKIEDALETIEDNTHNKKMNNLMIELFDIRKMLLHTSYTVTPMKDMLYQMLNSDLLSEDRYKRKYFSRIYDNLLKLSEMVTTNREITSDIRDNYLSLNSYQTNRLITVLTIVAAIFTPLTFVAGVYGMNFKNMPELSWANGYYFVLGLMGLIAASMFLWFKRKGWFK